jgi:hypothetical protein
MLYLAMAAFAVAAAPASAAEVSIGRLVVKNVFRPVTGFRI